MSEEKRVATAEILNTSVHVSVKLNDRYQGPPGPPGKDGNVRFEDLTEAQIEQLRGPQGLTGKTPQITVQVETGEPGTEASVMQSGTAEAPVIALTIPRGNVGATPQITVQVKTGEPGTAASVKQTGTTEAPVIELTIPRGDTGSLGSLTINGKAPDAAGKVMLTAADVGARADDWMPTAEDVGALSGTDATLTQAGKAADAKATGDELNQLKTEKAAYSDVLTLEEIQASTNLDNKIASAESAKGLLDRLGYIQHISTVSVDPNATLTCRLPAMKSIYLLIAGHITFPANNGIYMIVYYGGGSGCRAIPLCGNWLAQITGDNNGNLTITGDSSNGIRGDIYMFAKTD